MNKIKNSIYIFTFNIIILYSFKAFATLTKKSTDIAEIENPKLHTLYLKAGGKLLNWKAYDSKIQLDNTAVIQENFSQKKNKQKNIIDFVDSFINQERQHFIEDLNISLSIGYYETLLSQNRIRSDVELEFTHIIHDTKYIANIYRIKTSLNLYYDFNINKIKNLKLYLGMGIGTFKDLYNQTTGESLRNAVPKSIFMLTSQGIIGLEYRITNHLVINGEYKIYSDSKIYIDNSILGDKGIYLTHAKNITLGIKYEF